MSPNRASSKAKTFSGFPRWRSRIRPMVEAKFFEGLLLLGIGFLVAGAARLGLDLAPPQELTNTVGVGVLDAVALAQELVGL